jgi:hypothetical protein
MSLRTAQLRPSSLKLLKEVSARLSEARSLRIFASRRIRIQT